MPAPPTGRRSRTPRWLPCARWQSGWWLPREDRDGGGAGRAIDLRVADARVAGHLAIAGLAPQLEHQLVHLTEPGGADRLAVGDEPAVGVDGQRRSEEHTSELQSLMRISYAVFCLK